MERLNNSYYKLTSLFHQDGKGSVSWSLNITNVNIKINICVVITRASSHETSHEIYEFRVHSTPPKIAKINNTVFTIWNNKWVNEDISFKFPTCSGYLLSSFEWDKTLVQMSVVQFRFSLGTRVPSLKSCSWWTSWSGLGSTGNSSFGLLRKVGNIHGLSGISSYQKYRFGSD